MPDSLVERAVAARDAREEGAGLRRDAAFTLVVETGVVAALAGGPNDDDDDDDHDDESSRKSYILSVLADGGVRRAALSFLSAACDGCSSSSSSSSSSSHPMTEFAPTLVSRLVKVAGWERRRRGPAPDSFAGRGSWRACLVLLRQLAGLPSFTSSAKAWCDTNGPLALSAMEERVAGGGGSMGAGSDFVGAGSPLAWCISLLRDREARVRSLAFSLLAALLPERWARCVYYYIILYYTVLVLY